MRTSLLICLILASGCLYRTKRYAAPPVPAKTAPDVSYASAPAPGLSRVVLDVAEGPALVESVDGATVTGHGVVGTGAAAFAGSLEYAQRVCVTPCVVDTKPGGHELKFTLVNDPARTSRGFGGARLLRPVAPGEPYLVVADWDDAAAYQGWLDNPVRAELARQLEPLIDGPLEGGVYEEVLSG